MAPNSASAKASKILAYFSHSYREADREVNRFFWHLFHEQGFFFTVDPQSQFFSIPYLESMMSRSSCFVAVIPKRVGAPGGCSPYIRFEYGLAVQSQKPWLIFVEQGLSKESFARDPERVLPFNRHRLSNQEDDLRDGIIELADQVRGDRDPDVRLRQPAGLIVGSSPQASQIYTPELFQSLKSEMSKHDRTLKIVGQQFDPSFEFCFELEQYDFLVMEVREPLQSPWLAGYVLGRAMPSIKVCHLNPGETPESVVLPPIVALHRPEQTQEAPVIYWRDQAELVAGVMKHVDKFATERIEFHTEDDGIRYFLRAGRTDGRVFISNAGSANALARDLIAGLRLESIDFFHYQIKDAIPVGEEWLAELEKQVEESRIFVVLLSPEYLQSQWCLYELQVARKLAAQGKLQLQPYLLDGSLSASLTLLGISTRQARDVGGSDPADIVKQVVENVDNALRKSPAPVSAEETKPKEARPAVPAQLLLTEQERQALVDILEARLTAVDGPQRSTWIRGALIKAKLYAQLAGEDYSGSAGGSATTLVTCTEGLGLLPDGSPAVLLLVRALRDRDLVGHEQAPFLSQLIVRLERAAAM
jgi:hypothetical protein